MLDLLKILESRYVAGQAITTNDLVIKLYVGRYRVPDTASKCVHVTVRHLKTKLEGTGWEIVKRRDCNGYMGYKLRPTN